MMPQASTRSIRRNMCRSMGLDMSGCRVAPTQRKKYRSRRSAHVAHRQRLEAVEEKGRRFFDRTLGALSAVLGFIGLRTSGRRHS